MMHLCLSNVKDFAATILDIAWTTHNIASMKTPATADDHARQRHPIGVVVERTGLSQDVLRVWERRYRAVEPSRGEGGHRLYSDDDIARLRLLSAATAAGRSIGQVAPLSTDELSRMVQEDATARLDPVRSAVRHRDISRRAPTLDVVDQAHELSAKLDAVELEHVLRRAVAQFGVTAFIEDVASPLLRRIGEDWHAGRLSIAQEHLASSTVHDIIMEAMRSMARRSASATVLVATPAGERHAIGAALVGAAAAADGWGVLYLGTDVPATDIAAAAKATKAAVVAMSVTYVHDRGRTLEEIRSLRDLLPPTVTLVVGGAGATGIALDVAAAGVRVGVTLADLRDTLRDATEPHAA
jgi:MerR family transcriptional regulator, light-induced transcriptional regulator